MKLSKTRMMVMTGLAALGVASGGAATATGGEAVTAEVTLKFSDQQFAFKGRVTSDKGACEKKRVVRVFKKNPGPDNDQNVALGTTDSGGRYQIDVAQVSNDTKYYAVAEQKNGQFNCKEAVSPIFVKQAE